MAETVAASTSREAVAPWCGNNFPGGPFYHGSSRPQATVYYCPTVAHLSKQIHLTGEARGWQNSRRGGDWLPGWWDLEEYFGAVSVFFAEDGNWQAAWINSASVFLTLHTADCNVQMND